MMRSGLVLGAALLVIGLFGRESFGQNTATIEVGKVTTSTSQAGLNQIQPQDVPTRGAARAGVTPGPSFPPTPTPKPPPKPMTQQELDAHLLPEKLLSETSNVVNLAYSGFRRSQIDPCGCVTHQLGGIDKEAGLLNRLQELNLPTVKVDAGGFLRDMPTDRDIQRSRGLLRILGEIGVDAVNVGFTDIGAGVERLKEISEGSGAKLISANIVDNAGKLIYEPYVVKEIQTPKGETIRFGIVGVTRPRVPITARTTTSTVPATPTPAAAEGGYTVQNPVDALNRIVPELRTKADVVVVLLYDRRDKASNTITALAEDAKVDVVVTSEWLSPHANLMNVDDTRVVSAGFEGRQMGLLTMAFENKEISRAENQFIEVLQSIPTVKKITDLMQQVKGQQGQPATPSPTPSRLQL